LAEKTAKFAPFSSAVAPSGYGLPSLTCILSPWRHPWAADFSMRQVDNLRAEIRFPLLSA
jgi:hypothetical protein